MAWIQDDSKEITITVVQNGVGEGKAEVIDVWCASGEGGMVTPGQSYHVGGAVKNIGATDNFKLLLCFSDGTNSLVEIEKVEQVWADQEMYFEGDMIIPSGYAGNTITLTAIGFHEE